MKNSKSVYLKADILFREKKLISTYSLWFFVGILGIHRLYLGYFKSGVIMLTSSIFGTFASLSYGLPVVIYTLAVWWVLDAYFTYAYTKNYNNNIKAQKFDYIESNKKFEQQKNDEDIEEDIETVDLSK